MSPAAARHRAGEPCHECYPPFVTGVLPFSNLRAAHRVSGDLGWGFRTIAGGTAWLMGYNLEGEVSPLPGRLTLGARVELSATAVLGGLAQEGGAWRGAGFGARATLFDDRRGNILALALTAGVVNLHLTGAHADGFPLGAGFLGAFTVGRLRLLGALAASHRFALGNGQPSAESLQWVLQPTVRLSGPHHLALVLAGLADFEASATHSTDLLVGYVHAGDGFKGAFAVGLPLANREDRPGFLLQCKAGWEF